MTPVAGIPRGARVREPHPVRVGPARLGPAHCRGTVLWLSKHCTPKGAEYFDHEVTQAIDLRRAGEHVVVPVALGLAAELHAKVRKRGEVPIPPSAPATVAVVAFGAELEALPDVGQFGELGFANQDGLLVLTVPWGMAAWLREKLGEALVRGPEAALSLDGTARVAQAWVRLLPGMQASAPLGALGECGVKAG